MHPPRLNRLRRVFIKRPLYFVTLCINQRKPLLADPPAHNCFVAFGNEGARHGAFVGRYVLMPDHLHLFVTFPLHDNALSGWIKSLKNSLSKFWRETAVPAPHWQKGFFDHVLRSSDSYDEKWAYVAANPVRAGLAPNCDSWPYQGSVHDLRF